MLFEAAAHFLSRLEKLQYILLYYTVLSIAKDDVKSPDLHYGLHLQIKSIFQTKTKTKPKQESQGTLLVEEIRN